MNNFKSLPFFAWAVRCLLSPSVRKARKTIIGARASGDFKREQQIILDTESYWGGKAFERFGHSTMASEGIERIPEGPVLFVSNHQSYGDIILYMKAAGLMNKQLGFVARDDLLRIPLFGEWIVRVRSLMLERDDARAAVKTFKTGEEWLGQGFSLVIFPEGTRSRSNDMAEFKKGSLQLATRSGVPIVPVTLWNTWYMFEKYDYPHEAHVRFYVHEPIITEGLTRSEQTELNGKVEAIIRSKLEEWKSEEPEEPNELEGTEKSNGDI
jgi:1-acyl-sn-glycerol-3-phosphate acyltransferase